MRYFFLIYSLLLLLVILAMPNRIGKSSQTEYRIFPDMDEQDKVLGQRGSYFFADGRGARTPDKNIVPMGFEPLTAETRNKLPEFGFTNNTTYAHTGKTASGEFGSGIPKELEITTVNDARELLKHGEERFNINCAACHGVSADGAGVLKNRGFSAILDLTTSKLNDGQMFDVIANGRGLMGSFKHNTSLKDRWAIIAYLRGLQDAKKAAAEAK